MTPEQKPSPSCFMLASLEEFSNAVRAAAVAYLQASQSIVLTCLGNFLLTHPAT